MSNQDMRSSLQVDHHCHPARPEIHTPIGGSREEVVAGGSKENIGAHSRRE